MSSKQEDELATLKSLLEGLESGSMTLRRNGVDISAREVEILKREIAHIEETLAWLRQRVRPGG